MERSDTQHSQLAQLSASINSTLTVINEPKHIEVGAPNFVFMRGINLPITQKNIAAYALP